MSSLSSDENPFLFRERQAEARRLQRSPWWQRAGVLQLIWIVPQIFAVLCWLAWRNLLYWPEYAGDMAMVSACLQTLAVGLLGLLRGAATFARERDLQTYDLLRMSPMSSDQMYEARRQAVVKPLMWQLGACLPWTLLTLLGHLPKGIDGFCFYMLFVLALNLVSVAVLEYCVSLGMYYSVHRDSTPRAVQSAVLHATLLLGVSTIFPFVGWFFNPVAVTLLSRYGADTGAMAWMWVAYLLVSSMASHGLQSAARLTLRNEPILRRIAN